MAIKNIPADQVLVRAQDTPNPMATKFVTNFPLKNEGKATFTKVEDCLSLPLAESLMNLVGVEQIYFFENTVTVTHNTSISKEDLAGYVTAILKTRMTVHDPDFVFQGETAVRPRKADRSHLSEEIKIIEEILDRTIRPGLQADGGDIEIIDFDNNEVRILYQGACGGCPSAMSGTLDAIQSILRSELENDDLFVIPI